MPQGRRAAAAALLAVFLAVSAPLAAAKQCPVSLDEYEESLDRVATCSLSLAECKALAAKLRAELAQQQLAASNQSAGCSGGAQAGDQEVQRELREVQEELALKEELLDLAGEALAQDESEGAAGGRDLAVLHAQLRALRLALVEARQRLAEAEAGAGATLGAGGACPGADGDAAAAGASQALLLELAECREDVALLREGSTAAAAAEAGCARQQELFEEAQGRIASLAEENRELQARLDEAAAAAAAASCPPAPPCQCPDCPEPAPCPLCPACPECSCPACVCAACPPPPPCNATSHVANVPSTTPRPTRRTELLQNQLLADALAEVQQLEEDNEKLRNQVASLTWEAASYPELKAQLEAAHKRSAELSEELARKGGSLQIAELRAAELQQERDELKASLANSQSHTSTCQTRTSTLMDSQKRLQQAVAEAERRLAEADAAADKRVAAAEAQAAKQLEAVEQRCAAADEEARQRLAAAAEEAQRRLVGAESALAALELEKAEVVAERKAAQAAASAADSARRDAEVARATVEAELKFVREAKEAEVQRLERLLAAHEESAKELRRAEQLRREAETGWLPLWAQRRWNAASAEAAAQAAALRHRVEASYAAASSKVAASAAATWRAVETAVGGPLQPLLAVAASARQAAAQAWELRLRPLLATRIRNWPELEAAVRRGASEATQQVQAGLDQAEQRARAAKAAADAAVLRQLQRAQRRVPQLAPLATPAVASGVVWAAVACLTLPLAWALAMATLRWLLFRLRPGHVAVRPPASAGAWAALEASLGYQFEQDATRRDAVDGDAAGGTGRFAWLGGALLQLLAAEAAFKEAPDGAGPEAMAAAAAALAGPEAVARRAQAAGLRRLVLPGPGAKSLRMGAAKEAQLFRACLGAAFADSGFSLAAARRVFAGAAKPAANGTAAKD